MSCSNTAALNQYEHRQAITPVIDRDYLAAELCYGEDIGGSIAGEKVTFDDVQEALINRPNELREALLAIKHNDYLPLHGLLHDCALTLIDIATFKTEG